MNTKKACKVVGRAERAGWKIPEIAAYLGCSVATIYNWKSGATDSVMHAIARRLTDLDGELRKKKTYRQAGGA